MKYQDLEGKTENELLKLLSKSKREMLDLKMENSLQKLKNPHAVTKKRKELAQIMTKIRSLELKS